MSAKPCIKGYRHRDSRGHRPIVHTCAKEAIPQCGEAEIDHLCVPAIFWYGIRLSPKPARRSRFPPSVIVWFEVCFRSRTLAVIWPFGIIWMTWNTWNTWNYRLNLFHFISCSCMDYDMSIIYGFAFQSHQVIVFHHLGLSSFSENGTPPKVSCSHQKNTILSYTPCLDSRTFILHIFTGYTSIFDAQISISALWQSILMNVAYFCLNIHCWWVNRYKSSFSPIKHIYKYGWWFGTFFVFAYIGNVIVPSDEVIFFRGVGILPTSKYS